MLITLKLCDERSAATVAAVAASTVLGVEPNLLAEGACDVQHPCHALLESGAAVEYGNSPRALGQGRYIETQTMQPMRLSSHSEQYVLIMYRCMYESNAAPLYQTATLKD